MTLDIRLPIGLMFFLIGFLLTLCGIFTRADLEMYQCSLGININLVWGMVLLVFGVFMILAAFLGRKSTNAKATAVSKCKVLPRP